MQPSRQNSGACPICKHQTTAPIGRVLHGPDPMIDHVPIDLGDAEFWLLQCASCGYVFKTPSIPREKLMACYKVAPDSFSREVKDPRERNWDLLYRSIRKFHRGGKILDVGCRTGAMLHFLPGRWDKYGVDPSTAATGIAAKRGIPILGPDLESAARAGIQFDVITALSLVEHLPNPLPFFHLAASLLRPGGIIIIETGDTDTLPWRLYGSRCWYCSLVSHTSFYNRRIMAYIADALGITYATSIRLSHARLPATRKVSDITRQLLYVCLRGMRLLRHRLSTALAGSQEAFHDWHAPSWMSWRDHRLHILQQPPCNPTPSDCVTAGETKPAPAARSSTNRRIDT